MRGTSRAKKDARLLPVKMGGLRVTQWFLLVLVGSMLLPPSSGLAATVPAAGPPLFFAVRLEGFAVRPSVTASARTANPGSGYTVADIASTAGLDGSRSLQMKAVASTNDPGDLGGAALFADPDGATASSTFPGYAEAFFPTFEAVGQSQISEKCAVNRDPREEPACRDQPGTYSLAKVTPDGLKPTVKAFARNAGMGERGDTLSRADVQPTKEGGVIGVQVNEGRNLGVAGTPIQVESFRATSTVVATYAGVTGVGECSARVSVFGQPFESDADLQALLGPFSDATGVSVKYSPPSKIQVKDTLGGTKEVTCTGARFQVSGLPGGTSSDVIYGATFATATPTSDKALIGEDVPPIDDVLRKTVSSGNAGVDASSSPFVTPGPAASSVEEPPAVTSDGGGQQQVAAGPGLVERRIDTMPLAVGTAVAATILPLGLWLLLGVIGSLARGLPRLKLPPFRDPPSA